MSTRKTQSGAINMLLVSFVGLAALAITATNINSIRGTQESNLTAQTSNQAANSAWRGVEVLKTYLTGIGVQNPYGTTLDFDNLAIQISQVQYEQNGAWTDQNTGNLDAEKTYRIRALITGQGAIGSRKTLEVFYSLAPSGNASPDPDNNDNSSNPARLPDLVRIHSNLTLDGGVRIKGASNANFMVDGTAKLTGSVEGLNQICTTGDLTIESGIAVKYVCSNKSIKITHGATVERVVAIGNVSFHSSNGNVESVHSNGNVEMDNGGLKVTTLNATGNVTIRNTGSDQVTGTLNAQGNVLWQNWAPAGSINSNGDVTYVPQEGSATIRTRGRVFLDGKAANVYALGAVALRKDYESAITNTLRGGGTINWRVGNGISSGIVKGNILGEPPESWAPRVNVTRDDNLVLDIPAVSVPVIEPIVMERPVIDANTFKDSANYVFYFKDNRRRVTVRNVDGVEDGDYIIANYPVNWNKPGLDSYNRDYLCKELNAAGLCVDPPLPKRTLCQGFSAYNGCFAYNNGVWRFDGESMAPGVAWFEGGLTLNNGTFFNTFLATGNISTGNGQVLVYSPNYAGYSAVCTDSKGFGVTTDYRLSGIRPKNFCNDSKFTASPLGNVALLAGGFNNNVFSGGDIRLASGNEIYGSVMAGGVLNTSGSTKITGALLVANTRKTGSSSIKEGADIDLSSLPSTYDPLAPGVIPCVGDDCEVEESPPNDEQGASGANTVQRLWTRYAD